VNEASDSRARGAARGAIARRRGSQKGRACPLRSRAPGENATRRVAAEVAPARRRRGAVTGRSTLVSPLVYLIDAFASRRVRAKSGGCGSVSPSESVRAAAAGGPRAICRFVYLYVNGPVGIVRTVRIAPPRVTK